MIRSRADAAAFIAAGVFDPPPVIDVAWEEVADEFHPVRTTVVIGVKHIGWETVFNPDAGARFILRAPEGWAPTDEDVDRCLAAIAPIADPSSFLLRQFFVANGADDSASVFATVVRAMRERNAQRASPLPLPRLLHTCTPPRPGDVVYSGTPCRRLVPPNFAEAVRGAAFFVQDPAGGLCYCGACNTDYVVLETAVRALELLGTRAVVSIEFPDQHMMPVFERVVGVARRQRFVRADAFSGREWVTVIERVLQLDAEAGESVSKLAVDAPPGELHDVIAGGSSIDPSRLCFLLSPTGCDLHPHVTPEAVARWEKYARDTSALAELGVGLALDRGALLSPRVVAALAATKRVPEFMGDIKVAFAKRASVASRVGTELFRIFMAQGTARPPPPPNVTAWARNTGLVVTDVLAVAIAAALLSAGKWSNLFIAVFPEPERDTCIAVFEAAQDQGACISRLPAELIQYILAFVVTSTLFAGAVPPLAS